MKLNPDCIRDVLLYLEENLKISEREFLPVTLATLEEKITQYPKEDVFIVYIIFGKLVLLKVLSRTQLQGKCNIVT